MEPDYKRAFNELKAFVDGFSLSDVLQEKLPIDSPSVKLLSKN
jgi:hypothetical protein